MPLGHLTLLTLFPFFPPPSSGGVLHHSTKLNPSQQVSSGRQQGKSYQVFRHSLLVAGTAL
jgi:hypothetical protein